MIFLLSIEYWVFSSYENIDQFLSSLLLGVFWGSNIPARGIVNVGVMWFIFVFFWAKLLYDFLQVIFPNKYNGILLGILAYLMNLISQDQFHWFPQALDIVPIAALFMWCGHFLRLFFDSFMNQNNRLEQIVIVIAFIYWVSFVQNNIYIEMSIRQYPYFISAFFIY